MPGLMERQSRHRRCAQKTQTQSRNCYRYRLLVLVSRAAAQLRGKWRVIFANPAAPSTGFLTTVFDKFFEAFKIVDDAPGQ